MVYKEKKNMKKLQIKRIVFAYQLYVSIGLGSLFIAPLANIFYFSLHSDFFAKLALICFSVALIKIIFDFFPVRFTLQKKKIFLSKLWKK